MTPTRPVLRWHGGKWLLAPWIIQYMPPHRIYVEPYGGAASVLMRKPRAYAEVYNDLDQSVVNLFRVLRDPDAAAELCRRLELTPYSREEFKTSYEPVQEPIEWARRLVTLAFMGFGSNAHNLKPTGFRANSNRSGTTPAADWRNYPSAIPAMVERLRGVVIENRDALQVMQAHDGPTTLHYVDPPYVWDTRAMVQNGGTARGYAHEMCDQQHADLLADLCQLKGMVMLSAYENDLYTKALPGWGMMRCRAYADGASERTEVLWFNPAAVAAQPPVGLFGSLVPRLAEEPQRA